jgi:hypothetical protein
VWNRLKEFIQNTCCFCKQSCYGVPTHGCLNFLIFSNVLDKITFFIKYMVSRFAPLWLWVLCSPTIPWLLTYLWGFSFHQA